MQLKAVLLFCMEMYVVSTTIISKKGRDWGSNPSQPVPPPQSYPHALNNDDKNMSSQTAVNLIGVFFFSFHQGAIIITMCYYQESKLYYERTCAEM